MHQLCPCGPAKADGRNVLSANHLTQASVHFLGNIGPNQAMDTGIRAAGRRLSCKESDTSSATKLIAAGFNRVKGGT